MSETQSSAPASSSTSLATLLELARRARRASSQAELAFLAVNDSHALAPYRQSALWSVDEGVKSLSGVVQIEANAPYVHWLTHVCELLGSENRGPRIFSSTDLPANIAAEWTEWLPGYGLWLPLPGTSAEAAPAGGGLLFARDLPWQENEIFLLAEWMEIWRHADHAFAHPTRWSLGRVLSRIKGAMHFQEGTRVWRSPAVRWALLAVAIVLFPVRLTVLAPGELVPANPAVIRAPLDGVIEAFFVRPNDTVKSGDALFGFDQSTLNSKLGIAMQALTTAEAEYRQSAQLAVLEAKAKGTLAVLTGKIEERRAEVDYLRGQRERARVLAPHDGIALFDDPTEWIGRPVATGERVMRIASPGDVEVEAWPGVSDAIPLAPDAAVSLYLNASPLAPVAATVRYVAHDAVQRPDGSYAYRVRARLAEPTQHRVGLKGTAKLRGNRVPLAYWVLRRPLASIRQILGW